MLERFTAPSRELAQRAVEIAAETRATETRPEHLFAALVWDDGCLAMRVVADLGATSERLHAELDPRRARYVDGLDDDDARALASIGIDLAEVVGRLDGDGALRGRRRPRFARASKKVLELALREAVAMHHTSIGTEHVLLGLVRQGDATVRDTLEACGVDAGELRSAIAGAVRRAS